MEDAARWPPVPTLQVAQSVCAYLDTAKMDLPVQVCSNWNLWKQQRAKSHLQVAKTMIKILNDIKTRKLRYFGHSMKKRSSHLENEIMQGTVPMKRKRERPRTSWMDNVVHWMPSSIEEVTRQAYQRTYWRRLVTHGATRQILMTFHLFFWLFFILAVSKWKRDRQCIG